jgi:hypothetical protein
VSGRRAERTSLLSLGNDQCRFAVAEIDNPLAGYADKLAQMWPSSAQVVASGSRPAAVVRAAPEGRTTRGPFAGYGNGRVIVLLVSSTEITMRMSAGVGRSRAHDGGAWARVPVAFAAAAGLVMFAGCGSSKPAYCADRTSLQNSVKGLTSLNASSGISGLQSQLQKIQSDATKVVSSAKSDFPSQTSAIKASVDALGSAVEALPPNPSAAEIATIAKDAASVLNSVKSFTDASKSKCS